MLPELRPQPQELHRVSLALHPLLRELRLASRELHLVLLEFQEPAALELRRLHSRQQGRRNTRLKKWSSSC